MWISVYVESNRYVIFNSLSQLVVALSVKNCNYRLDGVFLLSVTDRLHLKATFVDFSDSVSSMFKKNITHNIYIIAIYCNNIVLWVKYCNNIVLWMKYCDNIVLWGVTFGIYWFQCFKCVVGYVFFHSEALSSSQKNEWGFHSEVWLCYRGYISTVKYIWLI